MDNRQKEVITNTEPNIRSTGMERSVDKGGARTVQEPGTSKQEAVVGAEKFINLKPEIEEKLKKFSVKVEIGDGKEMKTALDAVNEMNVLSGKELSGEQRDQVYLKSVVLVDKLTQKYEAESKEGKDLREILFKEVFGRGNEEKGQKAQKWFQNQVSVVAMGEGKMQVNVNELGEIMGVKLDGSKMGKLGELIKSLPLPEGVEAAPMVTVGEDGQITITPAPGEAGRGDNPSDPTSKQPSKTPENPNIRPDDVTKKEKEKFDWWKYRNAFLFFIILFMGAQGWYAGMLEKMAERAR